MSKNNFFNDDEVMSEQEADSIIENSNSSEEYGEDDESYLEVLKNANLRLEQGKLYQMLMKHNLFENVDADPKAVENVQRELRVFIRERLEVMVGLRQDPRLKKKEIPQESQVFSNEELSLLKEFAGRAISKTQDPRPSPVSNNRPTPNAVTPVSSPVRRQQPAPKPVSKAPQEGPGLQKPIKEMTPDELMAYNKGVSERQAKSKAAVPLNKLKMPDGQQVMTMYAQRVNTDESQNLVAAIMNKMGRPLGVMETVSGPDEDSNDSRI